MGRQAAIGVTDPCLVERHLEIVDEIAERDVGRIGIIGVAGRDPGANREMIVDLVGRAQPRADGTTRPIAAIDEIPFLPYAHVAADVEAGDAEHRSEEHTSELQSLMRRPYAAS